MIQCTHVGRHNPLEEEGVNLDRMSVSNSLRARVLAEALISMQLGVFAWGERAIFRKNIQIQGATSEM